MFALIFLLLLATVATAQTTNQVVVPPGDLAALKQAMSDAFDGDPDVETVIVTSGTFDFSNDTGLPDTQTSVAIIGRSDPIIFRGGENSPASLLLVRQEGHLRLQNIELAGFSLEHSGGALIDNRGKLELLRVQINSLSAVSRCMGLAPVCTSVIRIIRNAPPGRIFMDQVSVINSGIHGQKWDNSGGILLNEGNAAIQNTQIYLADSFSAVPLKNDGFMSLKNVSLFTSNNDRKFTDLAILTEPGAKTLMANSIVSGFSGRTCEFAVSQGHNLVDSGECNFNAVGDIVGEPSGLIWRPVENAWAWRVTSGKPILSHALVPVAASKAVDSIDPALCTQADLLNNTWSRDVDGNGDGIGRCDKGAVELRPAFLAEGGINGLYYDPEADGHYLSIIDNKYNTLLIWNTFDKNGDQAWIYGLGRLVAGRSLIADAYIKKNGSLSPDGEILPADEVRWGTLEVDMLSCREGTLKFQSDLPEFGSGQVRLVRLVLVKQLGCVD